MRIEKVTKFSGILNNFYELLSGLKNPKSLKKFFILFPIPSLEGGVILLSLGASSLKGSGFALKRFGSGFAVNLNCSSGAGHAGRFVIFPASSPKIGFFAGGASLISTKSTSIISGFELLALGIFGISVESIISGSIGVDSL